MAFTVAMVFDALFAELNTQLPDGTLSSLQRAVLMQTLAAYERTGSLPILEVPLSIYAAIGGEAAHALSVLKAAILFYAFADVVDDAQDHELAPDPWRKWGWEHAVNTGISLLFQSLQSLFSSLPDPLSGQVVQVFVRAGLEMTQGQHTDLVGQDAVETTLATYLAFIERKTASSLGAYCEAMALVCGGSREEYRSLGRMVGTLLQMLNDTHELWSDVPSPDFSNRRLSLPLLLALEQIQGPGRARLLSLLSGPKDIVAQQALVSLLEEAGIKGYVTLRIEVARRQAMGLAQHLGLLGDPYLTRVFALPAIAAERIPI